MRKKYDAAFEALERAYELRSAYLYEVMVAEHIAIKQGDRPPEASLKAQLRSDPRWHDLVRRIGLPDKEPPS